MGIRPVYDVVVHREYDEIVINVPVLHANIRTGSIETIETNVRLLIAVVANRHLASFGIRVYGPADVSPVVGGSGWIPTKAALGALRDRLTRTRRN